PGWPGRGYVVVAVCQWVGCCAESVGGTERGSWGFPPMVAGCTQGAAGTVEVQKKFPWWFVNSLHSHHGHQRWEMDSVLDFTGGNSDEGFKVGNGAMQDRQ
ncbi:hypothetical protein CPA60_27655, partial [Escherichia coli]|nr:hypothetical protein [Escherichia coli]